MRTLPQGWWEVAPRDEQIEWAKRRRERYDEKFPDKTQVRAERWHGHLAEGLFHEELDRRGIEHVWNGGADKLPDFVIGGIEVSQKTRTFKVAPRPHYVVNIVDKHRATTEEEILFSAYDRSTGMVLFLGGASREQFFASAQFVAAGDWLNPVKRAELATWNLAIERLEGPEAWLGRVTGRLGQPCEVCGRRAPAPDYPYTRCLEHDLAGPVERANERVR